MYITVRFRFTSESDYQLASLSSLPNYCNSLDPIKCSSLDENPLEKIMDHHNPKWTKPEPEPPNQTQSSGIERNAIAEKEKVQLW